MPKRDFMKEREQREAKYRTQEAVEVQPLFEQSAPTGEPTEAESAPGEQAPQEKARTDTRTRTGTHARTHARQ